MRFLHSLTGANRARVIDGLVRIEIMHMRTLSFPLVKISGIRMQP